MRGLGHVDVLVLVDVAGIEVMAGKDTSVEAEHVEARLVGQHVYAGACAIEQQPARVAGLDHEGQALEALCAREELDATFAVVEGQQRAIIGARDR